MSEAVAADAPSIGEGMFAGYMFVALDAEAVVSQSNDLKYGEPQRGHSDGHPETTIDVSRDKAEMSVETTYRDKGGLTTVLKGKLVVAPCPSTDGTFEASANVDVSATKGSVGQHGTLDVRVVGHVDDDARLASSEMDYRMQWAKFGGAPGEFVDGSGTLGGSTLNRKGGAATAELATEAASLGALFAMMISNYLQQAAQKGWESGR